MLFRSSRRELSFSAAKTADYLALMLRAAKEPNFNYTQEAKRTNLYPTVLNGWQRALKSRLADKDPVWGGWFQLKEVPDDQFAAKFAALLAQPAHFADPLLRAELAKKAPKKFPELTATYAQLLAEAHKADKAAVAAWKPWRDLVEAPNGPTSVTAESLSLALGHLSTGLNYYRTGRNDKAVREFNIVLRDYADSPVADSALYWSAQAWQAAGQKDEAAVAMAELAQKFPNSSYLQQASTPVPANPAPAAAPVVVAPTPTPPPPPPAPVAAGPTAQLIIKKVHDQTVAQLNDKTYASAAELGTALAELKRTQPGAVITFQREDDVDLQMVVDAINALDKAGVAYKIR